MPILDDKILDEKATGWVTVALDIDNFGKVTDVSVVSSQSSLLEAPALEAASKFRYRPGLVEKENVKQHEVTATVFFYYWDLAKAAGCTINNN